MANAAKYQAQRNQLERAVQDLSHKSQKVRKAPSRMGNSEARLQTRGKQQKAKKALDKQKNAILTRLEKLPEVETIKETQKLELPFLPSQQIHRPIVLLGEGVNLSTENKQLVKQAEFQLKTGSKVALTGKNGAGKTTFLNYLLSKVQQQSPESLLIQTSQHNSSFVTSKKEAKNLEITNPIIGTGSVEWSKKVKLGHFSQTLSTLNPESSIWNQLFKKSIQSPQVIRDVLAHLGFVGEKVYQRIGQLSGGEQTKVAIAQLLISEANVLLLDEPTNYLDINGIKALETALQTYQGTILFVTHDQYLIDHLATETWLIDHHTLVGQKVVGASPQQNDRLLLETRKTALINQLSEPTSMEEKIKLEKAFQEIIQQLKAYK